MKPIAESVYFVGSNDPGRRLFDALIPLPKGTSYNAYLVKGKEKTLLLDTVDPSKKDELFALLATLSRIDYILAHHAEQDHSGTLPHLLEKHPETTVLASGKGKQFLMDLLHLDGDRIRTVKQGDLIDLGGKTLEIIETPWAHWPETISSFLREDGILFSCDLFGAHLARGGEVVGDEELLDAAKRYYAEIMMPYRTIISRHLPLLAKLPIRIIAPSHGPVQRNPELIPRAYASWINDPPRRKAVIMWVSMHGSTKTMVDRLAEELTSKKMEVKMFDMECDDIGEVAMELIDASAAVFASPTVVAGLHPAIVSAAYLLEVIRPAIRSVSLVGSYGWSTGIAAQLKTFLKNTQATWFPPVLAKGLPHAQDLERLSALAGAIAENT